MGNGTPSVVEIERLLTFNAFEIDGVERVGEHDVIDVKILPSRSSDCLSHRGIARELASLTATPLAFDPFREPAELPPTDALAATIADTHACRRFSLALICGITVGPSPQWLQDRLSALGQRPINNIVDATNYVMFGLGQPIHAYDADKFEKGADGKWHFGVRFARTDEKITVLGGDEYELHPSVQLIVNAASDTPAGIAGIKGGAYSAIDAGTKSIIIEAANFEPTTTRKASQRLRLQTDASKRFENNIAADVVPFALCEVVKLITEIAGGNCEGYYDEYPTVSENVPVRMRRLKAEAILGMPLEDVGVTRILEALGFAVSIQEAGVWDVVAPFERTDIAIEEDVIEEVGRIVGYDKIATIVPQSVQLTELNARHYYSELIRETLTGIGFNEVITSSFRKKDELQLQNALAADKSYLRSQLRENLEETIKKNVPVADLVGVPDVRVFEIGTVFKKGEQGVQEHVALALGVQLKAGGHSPKDDAELANALAALEAALGKQTGAEVRNGVAEVDLTTLFKQLPIPTAYEPFVAGRPAAYKTFSTYPSITRDIALFVGEDTKAAEVVMLINAHAGAYRVRTTLFDTFTKDGRTSYAFRIVFQAPDRTLTDEAISEDMERIYIAASGQGWEVR